MKCSDVKTGMRVAVVVIFELSEPEIGDKDDTGELLRNEDKNLMWAKQVYPIPRDKSDLRRQLFCFDAYGCETVFSMTDKVGAIISEWSREPYTHVSNKETP